MPLSNWVRGYLAFAVIAALVVLGGCGGGDETTDNTQAVAAQEDGSDGSGGAAQGAGEEGSGAGGGEAGAGSTGGGSGEEASGGSEGGGSSGGGGGKAGLQGGQAKQRSRNGNAGGAGAEGGGGPVSPSATAFFEKADAICKEKRADTRQNLGDYTKAGLENLAKNAEDIVLNLVIPNLEAEKREIEALDTPASATAAAEALFGAIDQMIAVGKAEPQNFLLKAKAVTESEEIAKSNGFKLCGGI